MNLRPFKDRDPLASRRVSVHRNLHIDGWAITALAGPHKGSIVAYSNHVGLTDAQMRIGEQARLKIAAGQPRSVHAYIIGSLAEVELAVPCRISYRPHERGAFFRTDTGRPVWRCDAVLFTDASYIET